MTFNGWLQIAIFVLLVIATTKPLGAFMANVFSGKPTFLSPVLRPVERGIYAICGIRENEEQRWTTYAISMLLLSLVGMVALYFIQRLQDMLPLNPQGMSAVSPDSSFNTALSFVSNAEWQGYGGESTMSYLTQMVGITTQEFASPSVGIAVAIALIRGFARRSTTTIGNFWVDITRCTLYVLLPLSVVATIVYVWQGAPQNFLSYTSATTLEGAKQLIGQGPVASQEAIKMIGANGGGFFNANSAHPFENPNALTNLFGLWMIVAIPAGLTYTFGKMVGNVRQGWALFAAMGILFLCGQAICYWAEAQPSEKLLALHVDQAPSDLQAGGNMEGKEVRFGIANSASWAAATTATANGSVNGMLDSFTPLGGLVAMVNIQFGEVAFGGVGSGLYSMLLLAVIAIFIAGLMVGRTPEYLGKKIEAREVKMTMLAVLIVPAAILGFTAVACILPVGLSSLNNAGPHGFSEILYAFTSVTNNSGSAFAGLSANTPFYNITLGIALFVGRFLFIVPMLAVASSLAGKEILSASSGTLPTDGGLFVGLLIGVVVILTGLTYFSAVSLGPIVEHFAMNAGQLY